MPVKGTVSLPNDAHFQRLKELFLSRAVSFGEFTLSSGKKSNYYINSKNVLFCSEAVASIGELLFEKTKDDNIAAIGGLEVGAIPMATAAVMSYHYHGKPMEGFFVRKEAKGHGGKQTIEGTLIRGSRVAIVDDVLTTGNSALRAIEQVEKAGAQVACVICIVDRLQGAAQALAPYDFRPLYTIHDLGLAVEG